MWRTNQTKPNQNGEKKNETHHKCFAYPIPAHTQSHASTRWYRDFYCHMIPFVQHWSREGSRPSNQKCNHAFTSQITLKTGAGEYPFLSSIPIRTLSASCSALLIRCALWCVHHLIVRLTSSNLIASLCCSFPAETNTEWEWMNGFFCLCFTLKWSSSKTGSTDAGHTLYFIFGLIIWLATECARRKGRGHRKSVEALDDRWPEVVNI